MAAGVRHKRVAARALEYALTSVPEEMPSTLIAPLLLRAWRAGYRGAQRDAVRARRYWIDDGKGGPIGVALEIERAANRLLRRQLHEAKRALHGSLT